MLLESLSAVVKVLEPLESLSVVILEKVLVLLEPLSAVIPEKV